MINRLWVILPVLLLSACGIRQPVLSRPDTIYLDQTGEIRNCARLFTDIEQYVINHDAIDTQAARVEGFPYLRTNRFLSSFIEDINNVPELKFWLSQLRTLDQAARTIELKNIADLEHDFQKSNVDSRAVLNNRLQQCGDILVEADSRNVKQIDEIKTRATVPDNYSDITRKTGLYFIAKPFVMTAVRRLHNDIKANFNGPVNGAGSRQIISYGPDTEISHWSATETARILQDSSKNPLHIPVPGEHVLQRLFMKYAPVWEIEVRTDNDRPGVPYWADSKSLAVDTGVPTVYRLLSYARFNHRVVTQLNYIVWFNARTIRGVLDLLGGHLDGITWRVTLDKDGKPLMYDAMHNCGCYHMFLPDHKLVPKNYTTVDEEPVLVPGFAPDFIEDKRIHIRIASDNHYIQSVFNPADEETDREYVPYRIVDYDKLRSLPLPGEGNRGMFDRNGLVPGTNRKERWVLWPMGIRSPGAMRQWGRHAIAFIGKRHFDDPYLIAHFFNVGSNPR